MISSTSLFLLRLNIKLSGLIVATPFKWAVSSNETRIECRNTIWKTVLAYTFFPSYITYFIYGVIFDLTQTGALSSDVLGDVCFRTVYIISYALGMICMCNLWVYQSDFEAFVNSYIEFFFHIQETYVPKTKFKDIKNSFEIVIQLMSTAYVGFPLMQFLHCTAFPESKLYWKWLWISMDLPSWISIILQISHFLFLGFHTLLFFTLIMFHVLVYFICVIACLQILAECSMGRSTGRSFITRRSMRQLRNSLRTYTAVYILCQLGNDCVSRILYPVQCLIGFASICCGVSLIHFGTRLHWYFIVILVFGMLFATMGWIFMIHASGLYFKKTTAWIIDWKQMSRAQKGVSDNGSKKFLIKFGQSLRPSYVNVSGIFKLSFVRVLKFINFLMWGTMKALFLLRNIT